MAEAEAVARKREVILTEQNFGFAEARRCDWVCLAAEGTTVDDVLKPLYWSHVAPQLHEYDRIEVREETGSWLLELMVLRCERNWASVMQLQHYAIRAVDEDAALASNFEAKWGGGHHKWRVIRKSDSEVLHTRCDSQEAALAWISNYEQTQKR